MLEHQQSFTTPIAAPLALCYETIGDFEAYPTWSSPVTEITVRDRHPDGKARRVEFEVDMKLRTVRYVLEYTWHPPNRLTWKMVEGDLADIEGSYVFEPDGPKRTRATCSQAISLGFWVPSLIMRPIEQTALRQSVLEFKAEAERLAAARPAKATKRG
ncbi:MAG: SRPBCC family protein [Deltaproteobacteria bacterium]|nr:SRPBCC family protein [Deltaproteobacteria bacterium]